MADTKTEQAIADELREAAARLRSSKIDLATIEGLPEVVRVGGVPLARCVKCDCVARVEGEAVYQLLIVALLNAREPLASWLEEYVRWAKDSIFVEDEEGDPPVHESDYCDGEIGKGCQCFAHPLAVARVLNGGPS
jgi:hypothetical protein